jgi:putative transposase
MKVKHLCRKHGVSDATYYNWKLKHGGMEAFDLKRMKELEGELPQYKRMYAELARENDSMRNLIAKKL